MRTITKNVYLFSELSEPAKEKARDWWRGRGFEYSWSMESRASIKAFCDLFDVDLVDYSISAYCPVDYTTNRKTHHFCGWNKKRVNAIPDFLTGYCLDQDLVLTLKKEFGQHGDLKAAFESAIHAGFTAWRDDMEYQLSDDAVDETLIANEYEFYENGGLA